MLLESANKILKVGHYRLFLYFCLFYLNLQLILIKVSQCWDSSCRSLESKPIARPTEPQPQPLESAENKSLPDDFDGRRSEHVVLPVVEGLTRRHDDRLARVDAQRVDVLHVADLERFELVLMSKF